MATHWHLTVVRVRGREFYLVKSFHRNKLLIWSGIAWEYVPIKINQRKLSWFESLPFAFLSLFFFFFLAIPNFFIFLQSLSRGRGFYVLNPVSRAHILTYRAGTGY